MAPVCLPSTEPLKDWGGPRLVAPYQSKKTAADTPRRPLFFRNTYQGTAIAIRVLENNNAVSMTRTLHAVTPILSLFSI
jgi:hypothetical protein